MENPVLNIRPEDMEMFARTLDAIFGPQSTDETSEPLPEETGAE